MPMVTVEHEKLSYKYGGQMDVEALFPGLALTLEDIFRLPELG